MVDGKDLFLFVTAAAECTEVPDLVRDLVARDYTVYIVATPNVAEVTPLAPLIDTPGSRWVHAYRQAPLERFPFGTLLVAPCTFNTFNKIALGVADNLATSMIADGLGAGRPVVIAPAMNHGLWRHPQTGRSLTRLREWGCEVVPPEIEDGQPRMASRGAILHHLDAVAASG